MSNIGVKKQAKHRRCQYCRTFVIWGSFVRVKVSFCVMCKIGCARAGKSSLSSVLSNFRMFVIWGSFWVISGVGCVKAGKSLLLSVLCTVCNTGLFRHCNTLQHTATHWNTLQRTAIHCNALQYTATHCNTLQHTAIHCNTLQYTATHCDTLQHTKSLQYGAFLYRYRVLLVLIYHVHVF